MNKLNEDAAGSGSDELKSALKAGKINKSPKNVREKCKERRSMGED